jgi:hypothetical protein
MPTIKESIAIKRPIEKVFAYDTDIKSVASSIFVLFKLINDVLLVKIVLTALYFCLSPILILTYT